jgi:Resolvase, N terminal domain
MRDEESSPFSWDRVARSTKNFLEIVDELNDFRIDFVSAREGIDTSGAIGRLFITMIGSIARLPNSKGRICIKSVTRRSPSE